MKITKPAMESAPPDASIAALDREQGSRHPGGAAGTLITVIAFSWSVFQLLVAGVWTLNAEVVRAAHLAFAIALVFLSFPVLRSPRLAKRLPALADPHRLPWWDLLAAALAALAALYLVLDYEGLANRIGNPLPRDIAAGAALIVFLLEAARRAIGPVLPTVALLFFLYALNSERMPGVLATASTPLPRVIQTLSLGTEGIYGIPLEVSANTVFLFVLFGALLEKAGGGKYFIDLAFGLLGGFRGGPAKASVLASGFTGMINGSSIANTVTTGTFTIPLMKRAGYPAVKAGAIEVAASTNGQLMPPIMGAAAFIIAETCNMPYVEVVRAAFVPAFISYLALMYITHLEACKLDIKPVPRSELPPLRKTFLGGLHFLIPLFVLIWLLIIERRSARYAALTAIITLFAVMLTKESVSDHRNGWRRVFPMFGNGMIAGAKNMMGIGVAVAGAGIIVGVLSLGLSSQVTEVIRILSFGNLALMLIVTAIVSLILGMGLPTTANYIVMASLTARAIETLAGGFGLELPLIAIHLFVFYFGILSDDTPPVGLSAYAAAAISKADPIQTGIQGFLYDIRTAILPFMFLFNHRLLLIGVTGPLDMLWVFGTSLIGMFAFASATQGWLRRKNRLWENLILLAATWMLFRPASLDTLIPLGPYGGALLGLALCAAVYGLQRPERV
ncbi:MAG: TRAP transporter permease [Verrucomicrobia bacterium]|nr:TRAP transporter permease [Verrucomicrobiota bacterium]MCH8525725.1 TRAP transporter permease [Kiritimatiellia bacterium]